MSFLGPVFIILLLLSVCCVVYVSYRVHKSTSDDASRTFLVDGKRVRLQQCDNARLLRTKRKMFTELVKDVNSLIDWCRSNGYPSVTEADRLYTNWRSVELTETREHAALVVDKKVSFKLCVTQKSSPQLLENANTLRFVVMHELAHMMSSSYGHNAEFYTNFSALLRVAVRLGIYDVEAFSQTPKDYCGTLITNSPCDHGFC